MSWRPDNWDKIKPKSDVNPDDPELKKGRVLVYNCGYEWGVEAGADAIFRALLSSHGRQVNEGYDDNGAPYCFPKDGVLIELFIPDKE